MIQGIKKIQTLSLKEQWEHELMGIRNSRAYIVNYLFSFYQFTHGYPYGYTNMG